MMRILAMTVAAAMAIQAAPLAASSYAETAAELANAIRNGDTDKQRAMLPPLPEPEYSEIATLSGCDGYMGSAGGHEYLVIDWICASQPGEAERKRSTMMLFDNEGELVGFSINSRLADLTPTETALQRTDLPLPRKLARSFAEAVTSGDDASLGGLINLGEFELARLAPYREGNFRISRAWKDGSYSVRLFKGNSRSGPSRRAILQFDEEGRPTGVLFTPTYFSGARSRNQNDRRFTQRLNNERSIARSTCAIC